MNAVLPWVSPEFFHDTYNLRFLPFCLYLDDHGFGIRTIRSRAGVFQDVIYLIHHAGIVGICRRVSSASITKRPLRVFLYLYSEVPLSEATGAPE